MKNLKDYILFLFVLNILLAVAGYLIINLADLSFEFSSILGLLAGFSVIAISTVLIFLRGQGKEPKEQTFHTLAAMGLKFLLDLVLALIWFVAAKKNSTTSVIIFFVLYLTLTLFSVFFILKTLKNKSL